MSVDSGNNENISCFIKKCDSENLRLKQKFKFRKKTERHKMLLICDAFKVHNECIY